MHTTYNGTVVQKALQSQTVQTGTVNGLAVDTNVYNNNFRDVTFAILAGSLTDGTYDFTVEESDASGSGYAAVASTRVLGSPPSYAASDDNVLTSFGVRPTKRYVRLVCTAASATTGGVLAAVAILGNGSNNPPNRS